MAILSSYSPGTPNDRFGIFSGGATKWGEVFTLPSESTITSGKMWVEKLGTPPGNYNFAIYAATGTPGVDAQGSGPVLATSTSASANALLGTPSLTEQELSFTPIVLPAGKYAMVVEYSAGGSNFSNNVRVGMTVPGSNPSGNTTLYDQTNVWYPASTDQQTHFKLIGDIVVTLTPSYKDQIGRAYISSSAPSTMPVNGIVGGWGSSTVAGQSAGENLRVVLTTVDRTQVGNARIVLVATKTQVGNARITASTTKTQTGNARISNTTTRTQIGNARITVSTTKNQVGSALLTSAIISYERTIIGNARIAGVTTKTQIGNARISNIVTRTQIGNARITVTNTKTQIGNARIQKFTTVTQVGNARISNTTTVNQVGNARISSTVTQNQTGSAFIFKYQDPDTPEINTLQDYSFANIEKEQTMTQVYSDKPKLSQPDYNSGIELIIEERPRFK